MSNIRSEAYPMYAGRGSERSIEFAEGDFAISLRDLLQVIRRRVLIIVLVATLITGAAVGFGVMQTPVYEASTEILFGQEQQANTMDNLAGDVEGLQQITLTVAEAVDSRVVAEAAIEKLDLRITPETLLKSMVVEPVSDTQFIQINYRDTDPEQARKVANTIAEVSAKRIADVSPNDNPITANIWEPAVEPNNPVSPDPVRNGILALALGILLGVGLAFLLEYLDESLHSSEELEQIFGIPNLGVIPECRFPKA